jgi:hypothetical protein
MLQDKNGHSLTAGVLVEVPDPLPGDLWNHSFQGYTHTHKGSIVCVIDQDDNAWDIEANRLTILE